MSSRNKKYSNKLWDSVISLHIAVRVCDIKTVKRLLRNGADVNAIDKRKETPLHVAIRVWDVEIIKKLLKNGADVNAVNKRKETPLHIAVLSSGIEIVEILLSRGADVNAVNNKNETALHKAIRSCDIKIVKRLLSKGADVNAVNKRKRTPLHIAIISNYEKIVKLLLKFNADVNCRVYKKMSPLFLAVENGYTRIAEILLDHNANIYYGDDNFSNMSRAIMCKNEDIVKLLLDKGIDVHVTNRLGNTPLHEALISDSENIANEILPRFIANVNSINKGAKIDVENNMRATPLYYASLAGFSNIVEILLEHHADANYEVGILCTPFEIAAKNGMVSTVATFLDYVDINRIIHNQFDYPNYFWHLCNAEIQDVVGRHIIKMKVAGLYLNNHIQKHNSKYEQFAFPKECEEEIKRMQKKITDTIISFYDILVNRKGKSSYVRNDSISSVLESEKYKWEFPIYATMIERKYKLAVERQKLLDEGIQTLISLSNRLPVICLEEITSYLSNDDLRLLNACNSSTSIS